jgi:uncharacterized alkaline shock family protein YloU
MEEYPETRGKTTIDPGVLINIAKLAALSVDGVSRMSPGPHSIESVFKSSYSGGVNINVENNTVDVDLYLVLKNDSDLFKTSEKVQNKVARAITEMVGMEIGRINVHIEDIDYHAE